MASGVVHRFRTRALWIARRFFSRRALLSRRCGLFFGVNQRELRSTL